MMTWDEELWGAALTIERQYGEDAPAHVAERIGALAVTGDTAGVETWKAIAWRMEALARGATFPT